MAYNKSFDYDNIHMLSVSEKINTVSVIDLEQYLFVGLPTPIVLDITVGTNSFSDASGNVVTTTQAHTFDGEGTLTTSVPGFMFSIVPTDWNTFLPLKTGLVMVLDITLPPGGSDRLVLSNITTGYNQLTALNVVLYDIYLYFRGYIIKDVDGNMGTFIFDQMINISNIFDEFGNHIIIDNVPHVWTFEYLLTPTAAHVAETTMFCDGFSIGSVNHNRTDVGANSRIEGYHQPVGSNSFYKLFLGKVGTEFRSFSLTSVS